MLIYISNIEQNTASIWTLINILNDLMNGVNYVTISTFESWRDIYRYKTINMHSMNCIMLLCTVTQSCLTTCNSTGCSLPGSSLHGVLQARILGWMPFPSPGDLLNQGLELGLLHCRQILYHLSHKGSPSYMLSVIKRTWVH